MRLAIQDNYGHYFKEFIQQDGEGTAGQEQALSALPSGTTQGRAGDNRHTGDSRLHCKAGTRHCRRKASHLVGNTMVTQNYWT